MLRRKGRGPKEPARETVHCDFCSKPSTRVEILFAGPNGVHICNECVEICQAIILDFGEHPEIKAPANADDTIYRCSFCGKTRDEVQHLVAGPTVYICDECAGRFRKAPNESPDRP